MGAREGVVLRGIAAVETLPRADGDATSAELVELIFPGGATETAPVLARAVPFAEAELEFTKRCDDGS